MANGGKQEDNRVDVFRSCFECLYFHYCENLVINSSNGYVTCKVSQEPMLCPATVSFS